MYYIIVPGELCARRHIFTKNPRTSDGRVVLTLRDLQMTRFSYGPVEIVNEQDLAMLVKPVTESNTPDETDETQTGEDALTGDENPTGDENSTGDENPTGDENLTIVETQQNEETQPEGNGPLEGADNENAGTINQEEDNP